MENLITKKVYVGTWKKYNEGNLSGAWIDINKCKNYNDFIEKCKNLHRDESDPEFMIQDCELPDGLSLSTDSWLYEEDFNDIKDYVEIENEIEDENKNQNSEFQIIEYSEKALAVIGNTIKIKDELKKLGGKFNSHLKCGPGWIFSKKVEDKLKQLINNDITPSNANANYKELVEEYMNEIKKVWKDYSRMIEYNRKILSSVHKLSNGGLISFDKPQIETSFCFGYHHDSESMKNASNMSSHAQSNENYFIERNLASFDDTLKDIEKEDTNIYIFRNQYANCNEPINIFDYYVLEYYQTQQPYYKRLNIEVASEEDKKIIINAIKEERAKFEKRLKTYLKRYGLTKVRSWTYWLDE